MPSHFLVPVDFSPDADWALDYAIYLGTRVGARILLIHAIYAIMVIEVDVTPYLETLEAQARQELEARLQRVRDAGLEGEMRLAHGMPAQEIIATAAETGADLIIMGTHGRTGVQHLFIGSVAEKVVRMAPCPVLVTRRPPAATPSEHPC
jgi:nucleotide-binding universal stress UspA family protein